MESFGRLVGQHLTLDVTVPKGILFQSFLTNTHGHFGEGTREKVWADSGIRFNRDDGIKRLAHSSYVTYPWSETPETYAKSISDIYHASRCVNILGLWGLVVHLPKEYHLSHDFAKNVGDCFRMCEAPCALQFEITGNSTKLVSEGKLPIFPVDRMAECQKVIEKVARGPWGFCLDTAHAFVQGQPLGTEEDIERISKSGVNITSMHLNGSKWPYGSGKDQHASCGSAEDFIWGKSKVGLRHLIRWSVRNEIPAILERPDCMVAGSCHEEFDMLRGLL